MPLLLLWLGSAISISAATETVRKPNILFIFADDLGYGDLGCYGQKLIHTPNLDRLAADGMRFAQCYAGSAECTASRAALMTGLHTGHGRIRGRTTVPLAAEDLTLAEVLKPVYQTVALGEWGLGALGTTGAPLRKGFYDWFGFPDDWLGFPNISTAQDYYPQFLCRDQVLQTWDANANGRKGLYAPDGFLKAATNCVALNQDRPFFLYLGDPLPRAIPALKERGMQVPTDAPYSLVPWPQPEKNKAAMITRLDADVGKLLAKLEQLNLAAHTVVFFSSDNGPHRDAGVSPAFFQSAGPLRGGKGDLYEGGIRVPLIVRWPGHVPRGKVCDQICALWDILPTAAELGGLTPPRGIDGFSLVPLLLGQKFKEHDFLYWEMHEGGFRQAARLRDWKAVRAGPGRPLELYNLAVDIAEKNNQVDHHPELVAKFETILKTARTPSNDWPTPLDRAAP